MKSCFKCAKQKPLSEFYRHPGMRDGRLNKCKTCARADVAAQKRKKPALYRELNRIWAASARGRQTRRAYVLTPGGREAAQKASDSWAERNSVKRRAQVAASNAVRDGRLKREPCFCGLKAQAHHDDYKKPLSVRWLCTKHHAEHHRVLRGCGQATARS